MKWIAALSAALLGACAQAPTQADAPAVVVDASPQSRAELRAAVLDALSVDEITLADDVLTKSSTRFIERALIRDGSGRPLDGRDQGRPEKFSLVRSDDRCVLVHQRTGRRYELTRTRCRPEE